MKHDEVESTFHMNPTTFRIFFGGNSLIIILLSVMHGIKAETYVRTDGEGFI